MPTNQLKTYNDLLELLYASEKDNLISLRKVFDRDFNTAMPLIFNQRPVFPTPTDGQDVLSILFWHLVSVTTDEKTRKREFEGERAIRIHWVKYHLDLKCKVQPLIFQVIEENRVYILDKAEKYVIILEPLRRVDGYYLLTAYKLGAASFKKIMKKYENRSNPL